MRCCWGCIDYKFICLCFMVSLVCFAVACLDLGILWFCVVLLVGVYFLWVCVRLGLDLDLGVLLMVL